MIQIKNLQKIKKINKGKISRRTKDVLKIVGMDKAYVSLVFCDNDFIKRLNLRYFGRNFPTDVISFPLKDKFVPGFLGEVVISVEEAINNAAVYNNSLDREITLYIIHGILHLLGWSDSTKRERIKMEKKQEEILKKLIARSWYTGHRLQASGLRMPDV